MLPFRLSDLVNVAVDGRRAEDVRRAASWAEDGRRSNRVLIALRDVRQRVGDVGGWVPLAQPCGRPGPSCSGPPPLRPPPSAAGRVRGWAGGSGQCGGGRGPACPARRGSSPQSDPEPGGFAPSSKCPGTSSSHSAAPAARAQLPAAGAPPGGCGRPLTRSAAPPRPRAPARASGDGGLGSPPPPLLESPPFRPEGHFLASLLPWRPAGRGAKRRTSAADERVCSTRRFPPTGFTSAPPRARPRRTS